jgi:hypothetical protein
MGRFAFIEFKLKQEDKAKVVIKKIQKTSHRKTLPTAGSRSESELPNLKIFVKIKPEPVVIKEFTQWKGLIICAE